jgi:subtilase family serine protease
MRFEINPIPWRQFHSWIFAACVILAASALSAQKEIEAPPVIAFSSDHGPARLSDELTITVHLHMHNQAAYEKAVKDIYTPGSPSYHHWMTRAAMAKYAPSSQEVQTVKRELESHGLSILSVGSDNLSIRARGTVSNLQEAFQTPIHEFERNGEIFHANLKKPQLTGEAADLVLGVTGLNDIKMRPHVAAASSSASVPLAKATATGLNNLFTNVCFKSPISVTVQSKSASLPTEQYYGNFYDTGNLKCGWTPPQVLRYMGLSTSGLDGTGQTVVVITGPVSGTQLQSDLASFSQLIGLPAPAASNFTILYPNGMPTAFQIQNAGNWPADATLDVEWVHGIAPKAKVVLLIMPTADWNDFESAIQYTMDNSLGQIISSSFGIPELHWDSNTVLGSNQVLGKAASAGIAINFSSGDSGDAGTGASNAGGANFPADSPYVTSVGGTTLGVPTTKAGVTIFVGWGNNEMSFVNPTTGAVYDPPQADGFIQGSGGGASIFFPKPSWQNALPGAYRQQPDIAGPADPNTGGVVVFNGQVMVLGGTSWACPVFSAIWALADQQAGRALGQAAPTLAVIPKGSIYDVIPITSPTNPAGVAFDSNGSTYESPNMLAGPLDNTSQYYSALMNFSHQANAPQYGVISFGTDSSLTVTTGWDNVTGWGVPWGMAFINGAVKAATPAQ